MKLLRSTWLGHKVLVKCKNEAVITVFRPGKRKDPYLATVAHNVCCLVSLSDIDIQYVHMRGQDNGLADLLSRWKNTVEQWQQLYNTVSHPVWCDIGVEMLELDVEF